MKKMLVIIIGLFLFLYGCKEAANDAPPVEKFNVYYPLTEGNRYIYDYTYSDSNLTTVGTRSSTIGSTELIFGAPYFQQLDTVRLDGDVSAGTAFVRKTERGVYYFVDTSGVSQLIPDTLKPFAVVDRELILYSFPLEEGKFWSVYKLIILNFSIINMEAEYKGLGDVYLTQGTERVTAHRIDYSLNLTLPDSLLTTAFNAEYNGTMYVADSLGTLRYEGDEILFAFLNNGISTIADTTGDVIIEYRESNLP